jgi:hypothetical protein
MRPHPLDDLDDEIRDYLKRHTQENIERGMTPDEARRTALRKFGAVTSVKEDARAVWIPVWLDQLRQDVRYAMRGLRPLPFPEPERVMIVGEALEGRSTIRRVTWQFRRLAHARDVVLQSGRAAGRQL